MHKLILVMAVLLAGCVAEKTPDTGIFRGQGLPMWSIAQLDNSRLVGTWKEAAGFQTLGSRCPPGNLTIQQVSGQLSAEGQICFAEKPVAISDKMSPTGPGRFRVAGRDWWVIWVDTDYRTLAIASPSGQFGLVLERSGRLSSDRAAAAREIFDFNGYDVTAFNVY